jgi:hypothetical protein
MAKFRDARKTMFQVCVYRIGLGHLWRGQYLFHPGDRDLPLLQRVLCMFCQNIVHVFVNTRALKPSSN